MGHGGGGTDSLFQGYILEEEIGELLEVLMLGLEL